MTTPTNTLQLDAPATNQRGSQGSLEQGAEAPPHRDLLMPSDATTITESAAELYKHATATGRFYRRGDDALYLVGSGADASLLPLTPDSAQSAFETIGQILTSRRRGIQVVVERSLVGTDNARRLLNATAGVRILPEVVATTNVPILANTPRGAVLYEQGYAPDLKLLVRSSIHMPDVSFEEAVRTLRGLLQEFKFQTPSDESRAFAAFITPALQFGNWLPGEPVPVDLGEADQSQSGKTYRHKIVAAIYRERPGYADIKERGVGGLEESIDWMIFKGRPFIAIDNVKVKLDSGSLESKLTNTTGQYAIRLPHLNTTEVPGRFVVMISSNAAKMSIDLANRSCATRIAKQSDGYEFKSNPLAAVEANPGRYLACVFAIISRWAEKGRPKVSPVNHDFKAWAGAMSWIIQEAGLPELLDGHREIQARAADTTLTFLRGLSLAIEARQSLQDPLATIQLIEIACESGLEIPGIDVQSSDEASRLRAAQQLGGKLSAPFRKTETVTIDRFRVDRSEFEEEREDGKGKRTVKRYKFSLRDQKGPQ